MSFSVAPILRTVLRPALPLIRPIQTQARTLIPPQRPELGITTPQQFLKAIGREAQEKVKVETWEGLFSLTGEGLKTAGVPIKDRRYVLWALEKFRQGQDPKDFAHPPKPKKTIRGWGPKIQNGKRIR